MISIMKYLSAPAIGFAGGILTTVLAQTAPGAVPVAAPWWVGTTLTLLTSLGLAIRYLLNHNAEQRKLDREAQTANIKSTTDSLASIYERLNSQDERAAADSEKLVSIASTQEKTAAWMEKQTEVLAILIDRNRRKDGE